LNLNLWSRFDLALVTPCPKPPAGERWLHEIKHDPVLGRFRLAMVVDGEIAGPDERGITHISDLAFLAFDPVRTGIFLQRVSVLTSPREARLERFYEGAESLFVRAYDAFLRAAHRLSPSPRASPPMYEGPVSKWSQSVF